MGSLARAWGEYADYADQCAHKALTDTRERYWWQSRAGMERPPVLTDLAALARAIRHNPLTIPA